MFEELSRRPGSFGEGVQVTQSLWLCSQTLSDGSVPPFLESTYLFLQDTESFFNLQNISVNSYLGAKDTKKRNLTPPRFFFFFLASLLKQTKIKTTTKEQTTAHRLGWRSLHLCGDHPSLHGKLSPTF